MKRKAFLLMILSLNLGVLCNSAKAVQITFSDFGPSAIFESFEGLSPGPNIPGPGPGLNPGVVSPFVFSSGVILTDPIPNPGANGFGVFVLDFSLGNGSFGQFPNQDINSADQVPFGSAFLAINGPFITGIDSFDLTFPSNVFRVGGFVTSAFGDVMLEAFGSSNNLLETVLSSNVPTSSWSSNFLGLENMNGIQKIRLTGNFPALDGLTFEATTIPEPATILLIGISLVLQRDLRVDENS